MENNEMIMNEEMDIMDDVIMEEENSSLPTALAMAIGAGLTLAVGAGVGLAKKGIAAWKARKELKKPDHEIEVDPDEVVELATEE